MIFSSVEGTLDILILCWIINVKRWVLSLLLVIRWACFCRTSGLWQRWCLNIRIKFCNGSLLLRRKMDDNSEFTWCKGMKRVISSVCVFCIFRGTKCLWRFDQWLFFRLDRVIDDSGSQANDRTKVKTKRDWYATLTTKREQKDVRRPLDVRGNGQMTDTSVRRSRSWSTWRRMCRRSDNKYWRTTSMWRNLCLEPRRLGNCQVDKVWVPQETDESGAETSDSRWQVRKICRRRSCIQLGVKSPSCQQESRLKRM